MRALAAITAVFVTAQVVIGGAVLRCPRRDDGAFISGATKGCGHAGDVAPLGCGLGCHYSASEVNHFTQHAPQIASFWTL
jgi:hypothetical protein